MRIRRYLTCFAVACMVTAPALLHAGEEPERGEEQIRAESVSVHTRDELPPARRAEMMGRLVYHDRDEEMVVVIDEEGDLVRRIDAEDARVIVNEYTEDFLVARTPGVGEKTTVKVFDRSGDLKLDIEVDLGPGPKERIVGTLDNAVITRPFALDVTATEYKAFHYSQEGKQTLIEKSDKLMWEVWTYAPDIIWIIEAMGPAGGRKAVSKFDSEGNLLYEYQYPENVRGRQYFFSFDGYHLLTCYRPEDERHRRNFKLHIEGRDPIEWEAGIPRSPTIFLDDEEIIVYREWPQREYPVAYTYDGRKLWSVRNTAHSIAVHEVGRRSLVSSLELKEGVPRIAHYSLEEGTLLGVTALDQYINKDEEKLENVPSRFYADDEGNLLLPIGDKYVIVEFDKGG